MLNQNTTPLTNRLELWTHGSPNITRNNTSKLLKVTTILIIATSITYSSQDTKLSATCQLSKQDKHAYSREFQKQQPKKKLLER